MKLIALAAASFVAFATPAMAQTAPDEPPNVQTVDDPKGGYQPAAPLFSTPPTPGAQVIFVPSTQTPAQAYPPPPPQATYPICKRGQYDNCRQRGG
ncbi:hypothetical protein [Sphingomonas sp. G-3-2-10]|uniref:hypothetical protein n=1 Tax=Sphingomonas sp. G-3-2-10 TaxID=2728838 RepID=UPI00146EFA36|nr:hypothetical protein [Sphingomonas sp. G-3-2-10]NML06308.1 hypothetical protein [Sphingomonas sp. G-3-2-10]